MQNTRLSILQSFLLAPKLVAQEGDIPERTGGHMQASLVSPTRLVYDIGWCLDPVVLRVVASRLHLSCL